MASTTSIEWTQATWNPIAGCSVVSPGCTNCYAMKLAPRLQASSKTPHYARTVQNSKGGPVWTGKIGIASEQVLTQPLRRKKPTMYFVNSMSDLFHEGVPDEVIDRIFAVMALCPQHTFQILTKRPERMQKYLASLCLRHLVRAARDLLSGIETEVIFWKLPLPNVWLGVSVEDQTRAEGRIPLLLETPAAIRFISAEPLLGAVDLNRLDMLNIFRVIRDVDDPYYPKNFFNALIGQSDIHPIHGAEPNWGKLDWVIVGGESGHNARPMHPDWVRSLRDQCVAADVPFFFKQWGEWHHPDPEYTAQRVGKKAAGRVLDWDVWDEMPKLSQEA